MTLFEKNSLVLCGRRYGFVMVLFWLLPTSGWAEDLIPPQIVHEPCEEYQVGEPFGIWARFYDESPIFDPKVVYRSMGADAWQSAPFVKQMGSEDFLAEIPVTALRGGMEYFIEVFDENGNGPARYGGPEIPMRVFPSASARLCRQIPQAVGTFGSTRGSRGQNAPVNPYAQPQPQPYAQPQPQPYAQPQPQPAKEVVPLTPTTPPAADEALPVDPCEQPSRPMYCEAWLWVGISTVAILGAGFGLFQALSDSPDPSEDIERYVTLNITTSIPNPAELRYSTHDGN